MTWLLAHPLSPSPISKIHWQHTGRLRKRDNLLKREGRERRVGEGKEGGRGAESYNRKKSWSSTNHSIPIL
jgi:hypothetical protein